MFVLSVCVCVQFLLHIESLRLSLFSVSALAAQHSPQRLSSWGAIGLRLPGAFCFKRGALGLCDIVSYTSQHRLICNWCVCAFVRGTLPSACLCVPAACVQQQSVDALLVALQRQLRVTNCCDTFLHCVGSRSHSQQQVAAAILLQYCCSWYRFLPERA